MKELRKSRHKLAESTHLVVIPHLFSTKWQRSLYKAADVVLQLPAGHPAWLESLHEPLTIGILLPFLNHRPWEVRQSPIILELANSLQRVWKSGGEPKRPLLQNIGACRENFLVCRRTWHAKYYTASWHTNFKIGEKREAGGQFH